MAEETGRPFLARWSERKRAAKDEVEAPATASGPTEPEAAAADDEGAVLEANRTAAEAIDLDGLTDKSDYAPFLKPGVPPALKSAALHRLWRSNPVFAVRDGLNDYDEDYTFPKTPAGGVRTAWKIGRGLLADDEPAAVTTAASKPEGGADRPDSRRAEAKMAAETADTGDPDRGDEPVEEAAAATQAGSLRADAGDDPHAAASATPEPADRPKVGLARRIDLAAFAPPGEGDD